MADEYISLDSNDGICETVPIPVTGTYHADANGNWEGTADFKYFQAPYAFFYNNFGYACQVRLLMTSLFLYIVVN